MAAKFGVICHTAAPTGTLPGNSHSLISPLYRDSKLWARGGDQRCNPTKHALFSCADEGVLSQSKPTAPQLSQRGVLVAFVRHTQLLSLCPAWLGQPGGRPQLAVSLEGCSGLMSSRLVVTAKLPAVSWDFCWFSSFRRVGAPGTLCWHEQHLAEHSFSCRSI